MFFNQAEAVPIENGVGIPIILAVDPPMAPNGTTISPAEQHDFEEILNNSTISVRWGPFLNVFLGYLSEDY